MTPALPSGEQFELASGNYRAVVVEVGGGIRVLESDDRPIVAGYAPDAVCDGARGQLLLPWPNRIEGGSYRVGGSDQQLPITETTSGCAIHGLTRWANWNCTDRQGDRVELALRLHPQPGWPGTLDLTATYQLSSEGLEVTVTASNAGDTDLLYGAGAHPYLMVGPGRVDDWTFTLEADTYHETDPRGLPTNAVSVEGTPLDFRRGRVIGDTVLDTPFTDLHRDTDDRVWAHLDGPEGRSASIWADGHHKWFQVFTGDHLADPTRQRTAVAIEPMTCPPNAFRTGKDIMVLEPGNECSIRWGIRGA